MMTFRWNSDFWTKHNTLFDTKKAAFMEQRKAELGRLENVSANDLSAFYRSFLNERHDALMSYNKYGSLHIYFRFSLF